MPWVVESPAIDAQTGALRGTMRVWVGSEERARSLAAEKDDRSYREVTFEEMPRKARENLLRVL